MTILCQNSCLVMTFYICEFVIHLLDYLPPVFEEPNDEFGVDETDEEYRRNFELSKEAQRDNYAFQERCAGAEAWVCSS